MRLENMVAIITGAGRGMGKATAVAMAKEGAKIVVIDISDQRAKESTNEINEAGGQAISIRVDVSNSNEVQKAVETILEQFGQVDILVNNAGIGQVEHFLDGDKERWDRIIAVNLMGPIIFSRAVLSGMVKRKWGKIINIASIAGLIPCNGQVVYSASKGGTVAFTRSLAAEMAPHHINVNAICPGHVETPLFAKGRELLPAHLMPYYRQLESDIPWGRMGLPEDIARVAVFLASDDSEYITGQCISVTGGVTHFPDA